MYDILPFPNVVSQNPEEQINQILNYLIQLKESLEFILTDISIDNLSLELINRLNDLGANIDKGEEERNEQMQEIANKSLSVLDVINSSAFKLALDSKVKEDVANITFSVNFNTGNLEYTTS
jgi:hypothetical protein